LIAHLGWLRIAFGQGNRQAYCLELF